ncbi:hypothetical protein ACFE04_030262 [Oxalis oulophora]
MALTKKKANGVIKNQSKRSFLLHHGTNSLASVESLTMPLVQEVVLLADIQCEDCQKRIAEIMSRFIETESILINVLEKKVTLTCRYSTTTRSRQIPTIYKTSLDKMAMIKRVFSKSSS